MRLIDADELMKRVRSTITEQSGAMDWINLINAMPEASGAENKWIPVTEQLPDEDDVFKNLKEINKWKRVTFEKKSKRVLATVKWEHGGTCTLQAHTVDGVWITDPNTFLGQVIAWMPMPEPYREV